MVLKLAYYGNPILRKKTVRIAEITPEIHQLVQEMVDTMHAHNGIGLAAPQVKQSISLFITEVPIKVSEDPEDDRWDPGQLRVFINPKILSHSENAWTYAEGCLSIPEVRGEVIRPVSVVVRATDLEGKEFEKEFHGLEARCIMHENDHINGVLFIDRMANKDRKAIEEKLHEVKKQFRDS